MKNSHIAVIGIVVALFLLLLVSVVAPNPGAFFNDVAEFLVYALSLVIGLTILMIAIWLPVFGPVITQNAFIKRIDNVVEPNRGISFNQTMLIHLLVGLALVVVWSVAYVPILFPLTGVFQDSVGFSLRIYFEVAAYGWGLYAGIAYLVCSFLYEGFWRR